MTRIFSSRFNDSLVKNETESDGNPVIFLANANLEQPGINFCHKRTWDFYENPRHIFYWEDIQKKRYGIPIGFN